MENDTPYAVNLSREELHAVIKFHTAAAKRIPKILGKLVLEERGTQFFPSPRKIKIFHEEAKAELDARAGRARQLLDILKK